MKTKKEKEEEELRKLCQLVANEADPRKLSKLLDELIEKLDSRTEQPPAASTEDEQGSFS